MLDAAVKALTQILSPPMRAILWRSIGLALILIVVLAVALQRLLNWLATSGMVWAEATLGPDYHTPLNIVSWMVSIVAGFGIVFGAIFLMPAITSLVASVFVDDVADIVEREHYPAERVGTALPYGLAISEGITMLILKRVEDAERDGDRIYAVIKGVAGSSDGRGRSMTAPRVEGQASALRRAYAQAGFHPGTVGLIEAHGTGTAAGDAAELAALSSVFADAGAAPKSCSPMLCPAAPALIPWPSITPSIAPSGKISSLPSIRSARPPSRRAMRCRRIT